MATWWWWRRRWSPKQRDAFAGLSDVTASAEAERIAPLLIAAPDPRFVQIVLDESVRVVRSERILITETRHGFVSANGGVDHSNVPGDDVVTLLPEDPDASARRICERLRELAGVNVGVVISDTFGRPWRVGIVNVALGLAGVPSGPRPARNVRRLRQEPSRHRARGRG